MKIDQVIEVRRRRDGLYNVHIDLFDVHPGPICCFPGEAMKLIEHAFDKYAGKNNENVGLGYSWCFVLGIDNRKANKLAQELFAIYLQFANKLITEGEAKNIENARREQMMQGEKRLKYKGEPFFSWIIRQSFRNSSIGDLAKDIQRDGCFPHGASLDDMIEHLEGNFACDDAIEALCKAHKEWNDRKQESTSQNGLTPKQRFIVLKRDNYRCQLCGTTAQDGVRLEIDHKIPRAKGGGNELSNLWTLCWDCNRGKSDELL